MQLPRRTSTADHATPCTRPARARDDEPVTLSRGTRETKEQIENLKSVFRLLELKESTAPSPSTKGISKQAESLLERSAPKLRDQIAVSSALGNEHYEISAYQGLILPATAMGLPDVVNLLRANLDQEVHTSEELQETLQKLVA